MIGLLHSHYALSPSTRVGPCEVGAKRGLSDVSHPPDVPVRVRQSRRAVDTALRKLLILRIGWV
jgi:hypothetical protein